MQSQGLSYGNKWYSCAWFCCIISHSYINAKRFYCHSAHTLAHFLYIGFEPCKICQQKIRETSILFWSFADSIHIVHRANKAWYAACIFNKTFANIFEIVVYQRLASYLTTRAYLLHQPCPVGCRLCGEEHPSAIWISIFLQRTSLLFQVSISWLNLMNFITSLQWMANTALLAQSSAYISIVNLLFNS